MDFILDNYIWFIIIGMFFLFTIIGYIADQTHFIDNQKELTDEKKERIKRIKNSKLIDEEGPSLKEQIRNLTLQESFITYPIKLDPNKILSIEIPDPSSIIDTDEEEASLHLEETKPLENDVEIEKEPKKERENSMSSINRKESSLYNYRKNQYPKREFELRADGSLVGSQTKKISSKNRYYQDSDIDINSNDQNEKEGRNIAEKARQNNKNTVETRQTRNKNYDYYGAKTKKNRSYRGSDNHTKTSDITDFKVENFDFNAYMDSLKEENLNVEKYKNYKLEDLDRDLTYNDDYNSNDFDFDSYLKDLEEFKEESRKNVKEKGYSRRKTRTRENNSIAKQTNLDAFLTHDVEERQTNLKNFSKDDHSSLDEHYDFPKKNSMVENKEDDEIWKF